MRKTPVIFDGDMGGDDIWAIALLLANQDKFHIQGFTTVFGNTNVDTATRNARNFIHALGYGHFPVIAGARSPIDGTFPFGDDAYGEEGVGGVSFPESPFKENQSNAVDWMYDILQKNMGKVTLFATGPATNIAHLLLNHPKAIDKIERVIFMAGADAPPGRDGKPVTLPDGTIRRGNITPHAEFNAFQDPRALNIVIESGVDCHFLTMDSNQHLVLTPERIELIKSLSLRHGNKMLKMMNAVADLDKGKFGVDGAFIHDPNVILYALYPELYDAVQPCHIHFDEAAPSEHSRRGEASLTNNFRGSSNIHWATKLHDPDKAFGLMLDMFEKVLSPKKQIAGPDNKPTPL